MAHRVEGRKVRYAVVGGGQISQQAFMPGIAATQNSELAALFTGDPKKAEALGERYGIATFSYDQMPKLLDSGDVDAFYIATPNGRHARDAMPILEAGFHVLLEKPMAASVADCEAILAAQAKGGGKLMVAYRLHCEPGTISMTDLARSGALGDLRVFDGIFAQNVSEDNSRAKDGYVAGPVPDMGTYPLNAVRNLFGLEPVEVRAVGRRTPGRGFDFDDTVAVTLVFPKERIATFTVSYATTAAERLVLVGTEGTLEAKPCFGFGDGVGISFTTTIGGETKTEKFEPVEQFGGEIDYFSACILEDREPEPNGEEGLLDVRVLDAVGRALATGAPQTLEPRRRQARITKAQERRLPPRPQPADGALVGVIPLSA